MRTDCRSEPAPGSLIAIAATRSPFESKGSHLLLLPLGAVRLDVGGDDDVVQPGGEALDALADHLLGDHHVVPEIAARRRHSPRAR